MAAPPTGSVRTTPGACRAGDPVEENLHPVAARDPTGAQGALALSGTDKTIEAWMVDHMPGWLLDLTTRI
jgi:hypothetical protein